MISLIVQVGGLLNNPEILLSSERGQSVTSQSRMEKEKRNKKKKKRRMDAVEFNRGRYGDLKKLVRLGEYDKMQNLKIKRIYASQREDHQFDCN